MVELLTKFRRDLHRIPEVGFALDKTCAYVHSTLSEVAPDAKVFSPCRGALCAYFDAGRPGTAAFRADMDALPITEAGNAEYASRHPGAMHACGHDGHTAVLLGLAARLAQTPLDTLPHNVLLVFQPAEESGGGARTVCESGILEEYKVRHIFGLHLWPGLATGKTATRPGALMARASEVTVDFYGKAAHIARAAEGRDALAAGMDFLRDAYAMAAAVQALHLLHFGKFGGGEARNAVCAHATAEGSLRAFSDEVFDGMRRGLEGISRTVEEKSGCRVALDIDPGYPAVLNDATLYAALMHHLGRGAPMLWPQPELTAEDFAFYQRRVPGVFFFLGAGAGPVLHSPDFDFDEAALAAGLSLFEGLLTL